ncbi:MAG: tetratricopeptide repeat protein [Treponema sp.]|jgi:Ca-activated chloride channel family protein|nr:tetratricopeptide repeat protein [Treponema sp.]
MRNEKRETANFFSHLFVILLLLTALGLGSCSRIPGKLLIMEANFLSSRGQYTEAISSYLKALEHEEAAPYAEYGLGSLYYSIDEAAAALDRFAGTQRIIETLPSAAHRELRYRTSFNTGMTLFGQGDFSGAASSFREALRIDSGRIEAKRNLELSLSSHAREKIAGGKAEQQEGESESRNALFEYIREKEQNHWKSLEWAEEEPVTGPDY